MARSKLSTYRSMRDFSKTAEPSGRLPVKKSQRLRYVIQKHAARRLHFDLRLELDGVFKSWAVTRGPSLSTKDKRLAVEVEDHPLDYGDFEGTIPKGQYGGGTVQLWDRGYWEVEGTRSVGEQLKKGELKFKLDGDRLQGGWVLVRLKPRDGEKRTNWLLIKHRDEHASDTATEPMMAEDRSVASGRAMADIEAGKGKGPKPFMLDTTKVAKPDATWQSDRAEAEAQPKATAKKRAVRLRSKKKSNIPDFVEPQLCKPVDRPPPGEGWAHEVKFDGYRVQLRVVDGAVTLRTRKGLDWTHKFPEIAAEASNLRDCLIDGEIAALDHNGAPDFAGLQAALSSGATTDLVFYVFDCLFDESDDLRDEPLTTRKERLQTLVNSRARNNSLRIRYVEHFVTAGDAVLQSACRMSLEGIISKRVSAPYRSGRSSDWTKAKCRAGHEVVIGGWTHTGGELRSLVVGVYRGNQLVHVGRVGTGFGKGIAQRLTPKLKALTIDDSPFKGENAPKKGKDVRWVKPQLVAEIEFAGWTGGGQIRQAAFKGLREDKPAREVSAEKPASVEEVEVMQPQVASSAKKSARKSVRAKAARKPKQTTAATSNVVMGVPISNPGKPLWPHGVDDEKPISKIEMVRYYEAVGEWMLEHLKGRPCSFIRAPDGIDGERFFQRHAMPGTSNLITLTHFEGDRKPYIQLDRVEAIIAAAQTGAVELHPWNNEPGHVHRPGRLVFDLDPAPDLPFERVIDAAKELRDRLEGLGLLTFCKTTGGKGLHVVTPLDHRKHEFEWAEAKAFAQAVCAQMAQDSPDKYLVNMSKKLRVGKIFLDYLRNDRMATAVAPLSPRAREGAPVSMPLQWSQVKVGLDPLRYHVRSVPALLAKSKAWEDYCDSLRPLAAAIRKIANGRTVSVPGRGRRTNKTDQRRPSSHA